MRLLPNMLVLSFGSSRMEIAHSHIHYVEKVFQTFKVAKIIIKLQFAMSNNLFQQGLERMENLAE